MYNVIKATEDNIERINADLKRTGDMEILLSEERGDLQELAKDLYSKHSEYINYVYGRLTGEIVLKDVFFGRLKRRLCIAKIVSRNLLHPSEPIVITNGCQGIQFKYFKESGNMSFELAVLINYILHPELLSYEDVVEFLSIETCVIYEKISIKLEVIWRNQVKVDTVEFKKLVENNTPEEISEIKEITNYMYSMLVDKKIEYIYKDYKLFRDSEFSLIKDGVFEVNKSHGERFITATFPVNISKYVLNNNRRSVAGYIKYDGYLIEIPLYKFIMSYAENKKIYIPIEDFMDGMWECIEKSVTE